MRNQSFVAGKACPVCGMVHDCAVDTVEISPNAIERIATLLKEYHRALVVSDGNTRPLCMEKLQAALIKANVSFNEAYFEQKTVLIPDEEAIERIQKQVEAETELLIGIGSGVINDLCKQVSYQNGLPYMIIATAPSMDGYASKGAALVLKGMKVTTNAAVPRWIIADTGVIATAPIDMIRSGIGDIMGKPSSLSDWKLGALINGEVFCNDVYRMTLDQVDAVNGCIEGCLNRDEESLRILMNALVQVGVNMSYMGNSRPASGSEHHLSHFFEITGILQGKPYLAHGIDVIYSSLIMARLRKKLLQLDPASFMHDFCGQGYEKRIRSEYGALSDEILALQKKVGFYERDCAAMIAEKWEEIGEILREAADDEAQISILHRIGLDEKEFVSFYGKERILEAVRFARDLKDRYTVLWLMNDIQTEKSCVAEDLAEF